MIIKKELLNKGIKIPAYFDNAPVFKCPYSEVEGFTIECCDYQSEDVDYTTCCYNRSNCKFKQGYKKNLEDSETLKRLNKTLNCRLPFGRHKGETIQELLNNDIDYLYWLLGIDLFGYLADSLLLCSWMIIAEKRNKPDIMVNDWGNIQDFFYGHATDYPEYY